MDPVTERQIESLADAIDRLLTWQETILQVKKEARDRAFAKAEAKRNRLARQRKGEGTPADTSPPPIEPINDPEPFSIATFASRASRR
jgi:hypothetical protein